MGESLVGGADQLDALEAVQQLRVSLDAQLGLTALLNRSDDQDAKQLGALMGLMGERFSADLNRAEAAVRAITVSPCEAAWCPALRPGRGMSGSGLRTGTPGT